MEIIVSVVLWEHSQWGRFWCYLILSWQSALPETHRENLDKFFCTTNHWLDWLSETIPVPKLTHINCEINLNDSTHLPRYRRQLNAPHHMAVFPLSFCSLSSELFVLNISISNYTWLNQRELHTVLYNVITRQSLANSKWNNRTNCWFMCFSIHFQFRMFFFYLNRVCHSPSKNVNDSASTVFCQPLSRAKKNKWNIAWHFWIVLIAIWINISIWMDYTWVSLVPLESWYKSETKSIYYFPFAIGSQWTSLLPCVGIWHWQNDAIGLHANRWSRLSEI